MPHSHPGTRTAPISKPTSSAASARPPRADPLSYRRFDRAHRRRSRAASAAGLARSSGSCGRLSSCAGPPDGRPNTRGANEVRLLRTRLHRRRTRPIPLAPAAARRLRAHRPTGGRRDRRLLLGHRERPQAARQARNRRRRHTPSPSSSPATAACRSSSHAAAHRPHLRRGHRREHRPTLAHDRRRDPDRARPRTARHRPLRLPTSR